MNVDLVCIRCGARGEGTAAALGCPACAEAGTSASFTTGYDLGPAAQAFRPEVLERRPCGMWRYAELLPPVTERVSLGEGGTPLVPLPRLASRVGVASLWLKDESRNPTWSFKDRAAAIAASCALETGSRGLVVSSTGNAAAATAAYSNRAGIPAIVLASLGIEPLMAAFLGAYGALTVATKTKAERWTHMRRCVEEWECFPNSNYADPPVGNSPWAVDGYKTIAFEIWEQLGRRAPDWVHVAVAYGDGLYGVYKGFDELQRLGLADVPRVGGGEIYGSLAHAVASGAETVARAAVGHDTIAFSIGTAQSTTQALAAVRGSGGWVDQVSDAEVLAAQRLLIESEGIFVETACAAGLAALLLQRRGGRVSAAAECVLVGTSAGVKALGVMAKPRDAVLVHDAADLDRVVGQVIERDGASERRAR